MTRSLVAFGGIVIPPALHIIMAVGKPQPAVAHREYETGRNDEIGLDGLSHFAIGPFHIHRVGNPNPPCRETQFAV